MIDDVGAELVGRRFRLDAGDQLAARGTHHRNLDLGEALVELLDHFLLRLGEIGRVQGESAFLFGGGNQLLGAELVLLGAGGERGRYRGAGDAGQYGSALHSHFLLLFLSLASAGSALGGSPGKPVGDAQKDPDDHGLHETEGGGFADVATLVIVEQQHRHHGRVARVEE